MEKKEICSELVAVKVTFRRRDRMMGIETEARSVPHVPRNGSYRLRWW